MKKTNGYKQPWPQYNQGKPTWSKGDFLTMKHPPKYKNRMIKLLGIIAALCTCTAKAEETKNLKSEATILAKSEQGNLKNNHAEISILPKLSWEQGEDKIGYQGIFYRSKDTDGTQTEWTTTTSEIRAEDEDWSLDIGRSSTRAYYTPTTVSFDNKARGKGASRIYTGTILTHKGTGLTLGQVAEDKRMKLSHWDSTLLGWATQLSDEWGLQLQATTGPRVLASAAATLSWQPTDDTTVVAEALYKDHKKTGILTTNHNLSDDLTLFAGAQITSPQTGKTEGLATAGLSYNLGHGLQLTGAIQQEIGTERGTAAMIGIKYTGAIR